MYENGITFILSKETSKWVLGYNPISDRIITICLQVKPVNMSIIQVYSSTTVADNDGTDEFFEQLEETLIKIPSRDISLVIGNLNLKVGSVSSHKEVMGNNGLGLHNEKGRYLVEFC